MPDVEGWIWVRQDALDVAKGSSESMIWVSSSRIWLDLFVWTELKGRIDPTAPCGGGSAVRRKEMRSVTELGDLVHASRNVMLREEKQGPDSRYLWAYLDQLGNLHIDGQDLGPSTSLVSLDGEYEWFQVIAVNDLPRLVELLGGDPSTNVLDLLEAQWRGPQSYEFERLIRKSDIPVQLHTWSG